MAIARLAGIAGMAGAALLAWGATAAMASQACVTVCERYGQCQSGAATVCCKAWAVRCNKALPNKADGERGDRSRSR